MINRGIDTLSEIDIQRGELRKNVYVPQQIKSFNLFKK